jgi:hypothetical protein
MTTLIVQHEVKDYAEWEKVFNSDKPNLAKEGIKIIGVYTSVKNPNDVRIIFEAPNAELYDKMMSDPKRQEDIKRAGVITKPVATFLTRVQ